MTRARKICSHVDSSGSCPNLQPCPDHERKPWQGSDAQPRLRGASGVKRRRMILSRYEGVCHVCDRPGATEVDHVIPLAEGGADDASNLRPIHSDCHRVKSAEEAKRGRDRS